MAVFRIVQSNWVWRLPGVLCNPAVHLRCASCVDIFVLTINYYEL